MLKDLVAIKGHEDYEMSSDGKVRKADTKKYKTLVMDRQRRHAVVLPLEEGGSEVLYIQTLLEENFSPETLDDYLKESGESKLPPYESLFKKYREAVAKVAELETASTPTKVAATTSRRTRRVKNLDTGEIFNSMSEAAKHYNTSYDKFYDSVYNKGVFNGQKFERI